MGKRELMHEMGEIPANDAFLITTYLTDKIKRGKLLLWNALWQQYHRSGLSLEVVWSIWKEFSEDPISFFEIDPLMPRSVEIASSSGAVIYDALFLALAEEIETVMITADHRLLKTLEGTSFAGLARYLGTRYELS